MKKNLFFLISLVVIGGGCFYGGTKYSSGKNSASFSAGMRNFQDMTAEERQQRMKEMGGSGAIRGAANGQGGFNFGGAVNGEIISKGENSITIKLRSDRQAQSGEAQGSENGGSKIIFFSDSTKISKMAEGSLDDLQIGTNIMANGQANSDGSIVAENLQVR
ncbi:MAG: hypothetical protein V1698_01700 [bacterium]